VVRDCDTELYAASARAKAIACLSTDIRLRCDSKVRSGGDARAQRRTLGILAKLPAQSMTVLGIFEDLSFSGRVDRSELRSL
jgi:hypothetical protein